jgi:hypothetical protein
MANAAWAAFMALSTRQVAMRSNGEQLSRKWYRRYRWYPKGIGLYEVVPDGYYGVPDLGGGPLVPSVTYSYHLESPVSRQWYRQYHRYRSFARTAHTREFTGDGPKGEVPASHHPQIANDPPLEAEVQPAVLHIQYCCS